MKTLITLANDVFVHVTYTPVGYPIVYPRFPAGGLASDQMACLSCCHASEGQSIISGSLLELGRQNSVSFGVSQRLKPQTTCPPARDRLFPTGT